MEKKFQDISNLVNAWERKFTNEPSITSIDLDELKNHLLDMIDELKASGLDEEEAFLIATKRFGDVQSLKPDYEEVNRPLIQMRKSVFILAGVLFYYLIFFFSKSSAKLLFILLLSLNKNEQTALDFLSKYLILVHILFIILIGSIYYFEQQTIACIEKVNLKPKTTLLLLIIAIFLSLADTFLYSVAKSIIGFNYSVRGHFYDNFLYFDYSFPILICGSFIVLYFKYYLKTNI